MTDYTVYTDIDLWRLASSGDAGAEEELIERYGRTVRVCARPYFLAGGDSEDLIQEGMLGLLSAIRCYDEGTGSCQRERKRVLFHIFTVLVRIRDRGPFLLPRRAFLPSDSRSRGAHGKGCGQRRAAYPPQAGETTIPWRYQQELSAIKPKGDHHQKRG